MGYPTVPTKTSSSLHFRAPGWPGARKPSGHVLTNSDRHIQYDVRKKNTKDTETTFFINKQHQKRMKSVSLRSIRAKYGCLKQTSDRDVTKSVFSNGTRLLLNFSLKILVTHLFLTDSLPPIPDSRSVPSSILDPRTSLPLFR